MNCLRNMLCYLSWTLALPALCPAQAAPAETLTVGYVIRPGLAEVVDGKPGGTYLPVAVAALQRSGVPFELQVLPQKRLIVQVELNHPNYCALGIYATPERRAFAKFSQPFFRDPRLLAVGRRVKESAFRQYKDFATLSRDPGLKLGLIAGYSLGNDLDPLVKQMTGNVEFFVGNYQQNFAKVAAGRVDYIITFPAELESLTANAPADGARMMALDFLEMPPGIPRHFMCSKAVPDEIVERLNNGISALHLNLNP
ncbi:transporter substrate-binding domain-containing protein [Oxalobacteraceae bacterium]|nr:transporter substrate-binding domain-containing protein [Oxalobacteraceae bacterium]